MTRFDVISLGETMLRLSPPHLQRVSQAKGFEIHIGGSESNVTIGLAGLGLQVAWLSKLTKNILGEYIERGVAYYGVDTSLVKWTHEHRVGLYFIEEGRPPRTSHALYDRAASAMCFITPADLPTSFDAKLVHFSGITLALGDSAIATARQFVQTARQEGSIISFDTNYRTKLWSPEQARDTCEQFMADADIVFIPYKDANALYETQLPEDHLAHLHTQFPNAHFVMTLGSDGASAISSSGELYRQTAFQAHPVGTVGGGDAFVAGFLYQYLQNAEQLQIALRWGTACAAFKYATHGDMPLFSYDEIAGLVEGNQPLVRR